jgi:hypothetical protein
MGDSLSRLDCYTMTWVFWFAHALIPLLLIAVTYAVLRCKHN